jgi:hypothetical protein
MWVGRTRSSGRLAGLVQTSQELNRGWETPETSRGSRVEDPGRHEEDPRGGEDTHPRRVSWMIGEEWEMWVGGAVHLATAGSAKQEGEKRRGFSA